MTCGLELNQTFEGYRSAPISISLYYAMEFEEADGRDVQGAPGVSQVGQAQTYPSWADWSTTTGGQGPMRVTSRFNLQSVPAGATLFLRIGNEGAHQVSNLDNIQLSPPFVVTNGDFETPRLPPPSRKQEIPGWVQDTRTNVAFHDGTDSAAAEYRTGHVVVDASTKDYPNPGAAPVVFKLPPGTQAKKVRIHVTRLQQEISWRLENTGHRFNFALNEVLLFDGSQNVALNSLTASAEQENFPLMFSPTFAVDGYSYFPPIDPKEVSIPGAELIYDTEELSNVLFDLGQTCTADEVRFYPVDRSPQFSHVFAMGVGFPRNIALRMSDHQNLPTDQAVVRLSSEHQTGSHPLMHQFQPMSGRYLELEMSEGQPDPRTGEEALGFAEIELLQNGTNLLSRMLPIGAKHKLRHLTDGQTSSGVIQPQKEWLLKLSRRATLERELDGYQIEQEQWGAKQHQWMQVLKGAFLAALFLALGVAWLTRNRHRTKLRQLREKIGANLHDEVGANLSSIALSAEMLEHTGHLDTPQARGWITDITRVATETATDIRLLSRLLEKQGVESNIIGQLRRIEQQMLPGLQTHADLHAAEQLNALPPTDKWELLLFFKEALHNIVKHANATRVDIQTRADATHLVLEISDNGQGMPDDRTTPVHLAKRSKKLHASLDVREADTGGTTIRLSLPRKRKYSS